MVRDIETPHILEKTATTAKRHNFSWALPDLSVQLCCQLGQGCALARRELQPFPLSLTCPMAPVPLNTLQQQQGVNVCVCIERKGLPWPFLRFLHFLFPTHTSTGGHYSLLDFSTKHQFVCKMHHRNSTGGQVQSRHIPLMAPLHIWIILRPGAWSYRHSLRHY